MLTKKHEIPEVKNQYLLISLYLQEKTRVMKKKLAKITSLLFAFIISSGTVLMSQSNFLEYFKQVHSSFGEPGIKSIEYSKKWFKPETFYDTSYTGLNLLPEHFNLIADSSDFLNHLTHIRYLRIEPNANLFQPIDTVQYAIPPISNLKNIEFVFVGGDFNWDHDSLWNELLRLPKLKYLGVKNIMGAVKNSATFKVLLSQIEGLYFLGKSLEFPEYNEQPSRLKYLIYYGFSKDISGLSESLGSMRSLQYLSLERAAITNKDIESIIKSTHLKTLKFPHSTFENTGYCLSKISTLDSLETLELSYTKNDDASDNFQGFKYLKNLKISGLQDKTVQIPNSIFSIKSLKSLEISGFPDSIISPKIRNLKNLEYLNLYFKGKELPDEICELKKLKGFELKFGNLEKLPESIGNLSNLEKLNLIDNKIISLPESIGKLKKLKILDLHNNYLTALPTSIGNLENLEELNLYTNFLRNLPGSIGKLKSLRSLKINQNNLKEIPREIGNLQNLEELWLQNDKFAQTKSSFDTREKLPLKNNDIKSLPKSLSKLTSLVDFRISKNTNFSGDVLNTFIQMPQEFKTIDLSNCNISQLPQTGWANFKCKYLDLSKNKIDTVPDDLFKFVHFQKLDVTDNPYGGLSNMINSRTELMVKGYEKGIFSIEEIKKQPDIVDALMSLSSRYSYRNDENPILRYYPIALEVNPAKANELLDHEKYAEALFKAGRYKESLIPYEKSIQRDLKSCIVVTNFMIPKVYNAARAYLFSGDTIGCLEKYELLNNMFDVPLEAEIGMLHSLTGNQEKADSFMLKAEAKLQEEIENKSLEEWWGNELSLLEIYLITDQKTKFTNYLIQLKSQSPPDAKSRLLLEYFVLIQDVQLGKKISGPMDALGKQISSENISISGWSCRLVDSWSTKLNDEKRAFINELNRLICGKQ